MGTQEYMVRAFRCAVEHRTNLLPYKKRIQNLLVSLLIQELMTRETVVPLPIDPSLLGKGVVGMDYHERQANL